MSSGDCDVFRWVHVHPALTLSVGPYSVIDSEAAIAYDAPACVLRTKMAAAGSGHRFHRQLKQPRQHANKAPEMYVPTKPETFDDWWLTAQARFTGPLLRTVTEGRPTRAEISQVLADYDYKRRRKGGLSQRRARRIRNEIYEAYEDDAREAYDMLVQMVLVEDTFTRDLVKKHNETRDAHDFFVRR